MRITERVLKKIIILSLKKKSYIATSTDHLHVRSLLAKGNIHCFKLKKAELWGVELEGVGSLYLSCCPAPKS